jgi:hypothetical protein
MPSDASAGDTGHDDLVFAKHDLRRESPQAPGGHDLGFAPIERPGEAPADEQVISFVPAPPPPPPALFVGEEPAPPALFVGETPAPPRPLAAPDGFVIRETQVAPAFPVDALVVGGPLPADDREGAGLAPNGQAHPFKISSFTTPDAPAPSAEPPWTVRGAGPEPVPAQAAGGRGWSSRRNGIPDGSAEAAILRLREEALHVSWKSAWIAVTAANPRRARKR